MQYLTNLCICRYLLTLGVRFLKVLVVCVVLSFIHFNIGYQIYPISAKFAKD
jgi:hypothetical protein